MHSWRSTVGVSAIATAVAAALAAAATYLGGVDLAVFGWALGACAAIMSFALFALAQFSRSATPPWSTVVSTAALAVAVVLAASPFFAHELRLLAFERAAERSRPLVAAIRAFEQRNGAPPESLGQLVPDHLDSVPTTGLWMDPQYAYELIQPSDRAPRRAWRLRVELTMDQFDFDPDGHLPASSSTRRMGDWAYTYW